MRKIIVSIFFVTLFLCRGVYAFEASVSRTVIPEGESFQLYLRQDGSGAKPDISVLNDDFLIVSERQSFKTTFVNGKTQSFNENILTLIPKKTGKIVLPSIRAGKEKTSPVTLTVVAGGEEAPDDPALRQKTQSVQPNVFVRYSMESKTPYVGQQIPLTIRLYSFVQTPLLDGRVSPPGADGVVSEQWGDVKRKREVIKSRTYDVLEYQFLLFAQKSGKIELTPASFRGTVSDPNASREETDDFFGTSGAAFFSGFFSQKSVAVQTEPIVLNVKPIPPNQTSRYWLPATDVVVSEDLTPPKSSISLGEAVTRIVTVMASGVRDSQIPEPDFVSGTGYKQYPGKTDSKNLFDNNGIVGVKTRQIVFMPTVAGKVVLPAMEIPWFNVKTGKMKKAVLPARTITVVGANADAAETEGKNALPSASVEASDKAVQTRRSAGKTESEFAEAFAGPAEDSAEQKAAKAFWARQSSLSLFFAGILAGGAAVAVLWLLVHFLILKKADREKLPEKGKAAYVDVGQVKKACESGNAETAKQALLDWGRRHWPEKPPLTVGELAGRMGSPALSAEADSLNKALYANDCDEWHGKDLWMAFKEALEDEKKLREREKIPVPPLYPD